MSRKAKLFELMGKREAIALRRKAQSLTKIEAERATHDALCEKLAQMQADNAPGAGLMHPRTLYAKSWYSGKLQSQREMTEERVNFLQREADGIRQTMTYLQRKGDILTQKTHAAKAEAQQEAEEKAQSLMPPRQNRGIL